MAPLLNRKRNAIMADLSPKARNSVALQREMFRLAEVEHGLTVAVLARTRGLSVSTVKGWRDGAAMPAWALGELGLPDDISSLILAPYARHVGTNEGEEGDEHALNLDCHEYGSEMARATSPDSDGGATITHIERARLQGIARRMTPKARKVAA